MPLKGFRLLPVGICLLLPSAASAQQYTVTDLGTLGGDLTVAKGINAAGEVAGLSIQPGGSRAFLWTQGAMRDLGVLPGYTSCAAFAINDRSEVVGGCTVPDGTVETAFRWTADGGMTTIEVSGGRQAKVATAINNNGHITGQLTGVGNTRAFLYRDGVGQDIGDFAPYGINDQDQVVGGQATARMWDQTGLHDIGALAGADISTAIAIGSDGLMVGGSGTGADGGAQHAVLWNGYGIANLGTLGDGDFAQAAAISGALIVGGSNITHFGDYHAFIYDNNGPGYPVDLNDLISPDSGWVLQSATGINASGQIVGVGVINGVQRSFLLTPVASPTIPR
jgi:probable HAF family extracellular repeat protein